jgi:hypothetical protein
MAGGGSAIIGSLRVVLGADTAALDKGLKDSQAGPAPIGSAVRAGAAGASGRRGLVRSDRVWAVLALGTVNDAASR